MKKHLKNFTRQAIVVCADLLAIPIAWCSAYLLRFNLDFIPEPELSNAIYLLPMFLVAQALAFWVFKLYRGIWSFTSMPDFIRILKSVLLGISIALIGLFFVPFKIPRSIVPIYSWLLVSLLGGTRLLYRWFKNHSKDNLKTGKRTLIVGAGSAADLLLRELKKNTEDSYNVLAIVDDNPAKLRCELHGVRVMGALDLIPKLIDKYHLELVIIAMPSAKAPVVRKVINFCRESAVESRTMPSLADLVNGKVPVGALREISVEDLLGREQVTLDWDGIGKIIKGQRILVTGGGGSIGSELCRQIALLAPSHFTIIDNSEFNLYTIDKELREKFSKLDLTAHLVDVVDFVAINKIIEKHKPDIVFHAAAYKHVPLVENQARAATRNNILGTYNVANAAAYNAVKKFVLVSTDKAVNPRNIMGATKRAAEIICQSFNGRVATQFITVRFGNVLGSTGSVIPLFKEQLQSGQDLTVTDPKITRYFMTISEATQLILQATVLSTEGEIFVLDMGEPIKIKDLAEQMIYLSGKKLGEDVNITYIGLRPGEKLYEELFYRHEQLAPTKHAKIRKARYEVVQWNKIPVYINRLEKLCLACEEEEKFKELLLEMVPEYKPKELVD
jgi:FlaA1/EpsC-like NDP-sugar epimerase